MMCKGSRPEYLIVDLFLVRNILQKSFLKKYPQNNSKVYMINDIISSGRESSDALKFLGLTLWRTHSIEFLNT